MELSFLQKVYGCLDLGEITYQQNKKIYYDIKFDGEDDVVYFIEKWIKLEKLTHVGDTDLDELGSLLISRAKVELATSCAFTIMRERAFNLPTFLAGKYNALTSPIHAGIMCNGILKTFIPAYMLSRASWIEHVLFLLEGESIPGTYCSNLQFYSRVAEKSKVSSTVTNGRLICGWDILSTYAELSHIQLRGIEADKFLNFISSCGILLRVDKNNFIFTGLRGNIIQNLFNKRGTDYNRLAIHRKLNAKNSRS
jgi:hypothetical protein